MLICTVFVLLLAGGVFKQVVALQCYECTQSDFKACGAQFDSTKVTITNCNQSIYTIANVSENIEYACIFLRETDSSNSTTYTRRCSAKNLNDTCEKLVMKNKEERSNIRTECRQCSTDLCNSALPAKSNLHVFFLVVNVIIIIKCIDF